MRHTVLVGCFFLLTACSKDKPIEGDNATTTPASAAVSAAPAAAGVPGAPPAPADVGAAPADATKTASGLASKVLTAGTGTVHPGPFDKVKVNYTGWKKDGTAFDTTAGKAPIEFGVNEVIKGWTEGVQLMVVGEKRRLWIPGEMAYGTRPSHGPDGPPTGDLVFDVELVALTPGPKPPEVPTDVKAAPADAKKTTSGLQYKTLTAGKGKKHPAATDKVTVHYSGWTPDGKMFDSSVMRGEPTSFGLDHVIKGWTEGVQLMVEGDKTRFWIPSDLAYGDKPKRPGAPAGPLVFDIELISIAP
jgi:peptidylprolyl isomerase